MSNQLRSMPLLYFLSFVPLGMIFPYLVTEFEARSIPNIGVLLAMPSFVMVFVGPLWGWLADWLQDAVRTLQVAVWIAIVGWGCVVLFDPSMVWVGMLLYSIGWAPVASLSDAMTLEGLRQVSMKKEDVQRLPSELSWTYGGIRQWGSIGYMVGVGTIGWATGWGIVGGAVVTLSLGVYVLSIPKLKVAFPRPQWSDVRTLLGNSRLLWVLLCAGLHFSVHLGNSSYIIKHAQETGVSTGWASTAILLGVVVEIAVFKKAELFERINAKKLLVWSCALAIPRWALMTWTAHVWMLVLAQATHGITFGVFWLAVVRLVKGITPPELSSTGQSLLSTSVGGVGAVVGMYGASVLVDWSSTTTFYAVAIGVAVLATVGSLLVRE